MSDHIDVTGLPDPLVAAIGSMIRTYRERVATPRTPPAADATQAFGDPPVGWMKGKIDLTDAFFEPLPDDLLAAFNGEGNLKGPP